MKKQKPAGQYIVRKCNESKLFDRALEHFHVKEIANDYFQKWHDATSEEEKEEVTKEYYRELSLALLLPFGITTGTAVVINSTNEVVLIGLFVITIAAIGRLHE
ncbi:MAG: hypothetical protein WAU15_08640 [Nitrosomonas sp.]